MARSSVGSRRAIRVEALERRELLAADLQVVHNSPYEAAAVVDVYVNNELALNDFEFRQATPFLSLPSEVAIKIDITAADAADNSNPVFSTELTLAEGVSYVAMAVGDPLASDESAFTLAVTDVARTTAEDSNVAEILVFHGSPDAPTVDVQARDVGTLVDDLSYTEFAADYLPVAPDVYTIDITLEDGRTRVAAFEADLSGAAGAAIVVAASGFAVPQSESAPSFGLLAVFPDGTTALLPSVAQVIEGTNGRDAFVARVAVSNPGVLEIVGPGREVTHFLIATTPSVEILGLRNNDSLTVFAPEAADIILPNIVFDGGQGYDTVTVYGTRHADNISLTESVGLEFGINNSLVTALSTDAASVYALGGDDVIDARQVDTINLLLDAGNGNDEVQGGNAVDIIFGGAGNDLLYGNDGNDIIFGGGGRDRIWGGRGLDIMFGQGGNDEIDGRRRRFFIG